MTTPTVIEIRRNGNPVAGERVELARYTISCGTRVLIGQRVNGSVRISDHPAEGRGRAVLIERGLEQDGNAALWALVNDYVQQAALHDQVPMLASPIERYLDHLENRPDGIHRQPRAS